MYILVIRKEFDDGTFIHHAEEFNNVGLQAVKLIGEDEFKNEDCVGYVIYEATEVFSKTI